MPLAGYLNNYRVRFDFKAANMNPPLVGQHIFFITDGKGMVVDDDQPVFRRTGNTFE